MLLTKLIMKNKLIKFNDVSAVVGCDYVEKLVRKHGELDWNEKES